VLNEMLLFYFYLMCDVGGGKCCFCDSTETVNHLFVHCPFAKIIWQMVFFSYNIPHQQMLLICLVDG
jgi:hypothetical protein